MNEALVSEYLNGQIPVGRVMAQGRDGHSEHGDHRRASANAHYENVRGPIPRQTFVSLGGGAPHAQRRLGLTSTRGRTAIRAR